MSNRSRPRWTTTALTFLYMWLVIGFFLGTLVLIGPVRWLTAAVHRAGGSDSVENAFVILLVVIYVAFSAWLALRLSRTVWRGTTPLSRYGVPLVATLLAASAVIAWRNPGKMLSAVAGGGNIEDVQTASGAVFEFGPYPDADLLRELKSRGVTTVISLQHPDVPVERPGIAEEDKNAKDIGITLVHAPMLPWFSENKASLDTLRAIALKGRGKFYVHCGLGRDRVNIARKLIEGVGAKAVAAKGYHEGLGFAYRTAPFGRGPIVKLASGVWMVPFPDHEELYGCFLQGSPGHVVVALDVADTTEKALLDDAKRLLDPVAFQYVVLPIDYSKPVTLQTVVDSLRRIPPPLTLVVRSTQGLGENGVQNKGWEHSVDLKGEYLKAPSALHQAYRAPPEARGAQDTRAGC